MPGKTLTKGDNHLTMQVVNHVRTLIEKGSLKPGDRIPPEREFAQMLKISRASLRTGIGYLAAMGVMNVRHGVGTFVADGPPEIGRSSLSLLGALHGFQLWQMFEARRLLEGSLAALAAERGREEHLMALSEEVTEMYATVQDPAEYLIHDVRFHRTIAQAAGNPILAVLMETITSSLYGDRRKTVERTTSLKESADMHREIYRAIRTRDAVEARNVMERHLKMAEKAQMNEAASSQTKAKKKRRASGTASS
ncbi:FadR/GntR family transcriptional regulator [Paracidobacterium acidisoli]|uniref:FadR family transcriptional regulator n=1 Tax=Paracidobacterium acidisoli TaxID=2303751 RepID=A0A372IKH3_9BACT|nr:FadR/GntR family transcriptional regulator [Paracidobacterium acidisoli]MBT9332589.1 FadR family transcriptional regulator [Paracidobacterium acidisoli]